VNNPDGTLGKDARRLRSAADRAVLKDLRDRVVDLAIEFEDAKTRGDQFNDLETDESLTTEQIATLQITDNDYNSSKQKLFEAVRILKMEASHQGVAP
jgi:hypothetical protein